MRQQQQQHNEKEHESFTTKANDFQYPFSRYENTFKNLSKISTNKFNQKFKWCVSVNIKNSIFEMT